jgi:membrane-bound lytic murein transglycosylase B
MSSFLIIHHPSDWALKKKRGPAKFQTMKKQDLRLETYLLTLILLVFISTATYGEDFIEIPSHYRPLIHRLSQDGFDFEFLSKLFTDPRVELNPAFMTLSMVSRETKGLYAQFLNEESILLSKKFLHQNIKLLNEMEKQFNVEKEVIVAILLVESKFGENIGKYRVIPTLVSMALMNSEDNLKKNYLTLKEIDPEISFNWIEGLANRRASWAYQELKCFLRIIRDEKMDPLDVFGSTAGALGMPQFIPSSYLAYALNKNGFEKWLFSIEEAIFSIGNYLKSHGWKKSLSTGKKKRILWYYNRSIPYIETILQIAQRIKQK